MASEASVVVLVAGLAGNALDFLDAALERSLGSRNAVVVLAVEHMPSDVDAFEVTRVRGADAIVEIVTDERLDRCELRVCSPSAPCSGRAVEFTEHDERDARERAISIVAVAMLPERARAAAAQPVADAPSPLAPKTVGPVLAPTVPVPPTFQLEASFATTLGSPSTFGAEAGLRARLFRVAWARVGAGARAGSLAGLATTVDVPLSAGFAATIPVSKALDLGLRVDAVLQRRSVSLAERGGRSRWLAALRPGVEVRAHVAEFFGVRGFVAFEASGGTTDVDVAGAHATMALVRAYAEVGPYLMF